MAGLVPAIHVFLSRKLVKAWMPGMKPGMTRTGSAMTGEYPAALSIQLWSVPDV